MSESTRRGAGPILIGAILIVTIAAGLAALLVSAEHRSAAILLSIPAAFLITLAIQSLPALPRLSAILSAVTLVLTLLFGRGSSEQFGQTWLAIGVTLAVYLPAWNAGLRVYVNKEAAEPIQTLNPDATARALVIYHPGRSSLQHRANTAFARALAANGWRVDVGTIGQHTPTRLKCYDLLVLGTPTYEWAPSDRMRHYLRDVGDLRNRPVVLIVSAMGAPQHAVESMERLVSALNGRVIRSLPLRVRNNARAYGTNDLDEIMAREAAAIDMPTGGTAAGSPPASAPITRPGL
ncbi:MAG: flavodoxin family protein [Anaerolineae bacterium]|jgi:hypothetical protein